MQVLGRILVAIVVLVVVGVLVALVASGSDIRRYRRMSQM